MPYDFQVWEEEDLLVQSFLSGAILEHVYPCLYDNDAASYHVVMPDNFVSQVLTEEAGTCQAQAFKAISQPGNQNMGHVVPHAGNLDQQAPAMEAQVPGVQYLGQLVYPDDIVPAAVALGGNIVVEHLAAADNNPPPAADQLPQELADLNLDDDEGHSSSSDSVPALMAPSSSDSEPEMLAWLLN